MASEQNPTEGAPKHQRRIRYSGTHPKKYQEKYKELNPEQYAADIAKIIDKGNTPAGMHISICVNEILHFLQIQPGQTGLDATLGYGGHTRAMLEQLNSQGHLYATDVDPIEMPRTRERLAHLGYGPGLLEIRQMNFSRIDELLPEAGLFDFVLADLGVSSMQIDNPDRGFSFKADGPLDLRLNPEAGEPASALLPKLSVAELEDMLLANADEPHARIIAKAIVNAIKKGQAIETTTQLRDLIKKTLQPLSEIGEDDIKKSCQRSFQALRIDINNEFDVLDEFLSKLPAVLAPGGRVAILTFHSGEDRRVKQAFKHYLREGLFTEIATDPGRASAEECHRNSRARSAKLRWAIKA